ncbi:hypothetical protein HPB47_008809 [Ixodes persulcatus]|uniref:Uncharacterized protein n=1 Tax=Ixodes persulcatus TaxID=34615 RepID=A0AC60P3N8_IXOPE|nr:hypothetical protein HPB47_008809 [Ixodes persulcatus]
MQRAPRSSEPHAGTMPIQVQARWGLDGGFCSASSMHPVAGAVSSTGGESATRGAVAGGTDPWRRPRRVLPDSGGRLGNKGGHARRRSSTRTTVRVDDPRRRLASPNSQGALPSDRSANDALCQTK